METKNFDAYEFIAVIIPGSVVALLVILKWDDLKSLIGTNGFSVGGLGLFTVIAFVLGHLLQGLGNIVDSVFWAVSGLPTTWVRKQRQTLISPSERNELLAKLAGMEGQAIDVTSIGRARWQAIIARAYHRVRDAGKSDRIDTFNRTYGLGRGLAAAFLVSAVWLLFLYPATRTPSLTALAMAIVSLWRMYIFGKLYARALLQAFIDI